MTNTIDTLLKNLEEEHRHLELLTSALERKKEAIITNHRPSLEGVLQEIDGLLVSMNILSEGRASLILSARTELDLEESETPPRLEDLANAMEQIEDDRTEHLRELRERLKSATGHIVRISRLCAALVTHSIEHTNHFFQAVADAMTGPPVYDRHGGVRPLSRIMVDQKA
ncbi:MAG: flagellar protein FlgN [Planctomycetota bacterium]|jgi:hypothetical protein|nr:flagellar protein FlgN [Planctomycetota bacterium]